MLGKVNRNKKATVVAGYTKNTAPRGVEAEASSPKDGIFDCPSTGWGVRGVLMNGDVTLVANDDGIRRFNLKRDAEAFIDSEDGRALLCDDVVSISAMNFAKEEM